jgi:hypothetical protein
LIGNNLRKGYEKRGRATYFGEKEEKPQVLKPRERKFQG